MFQQRDTENLQLLHWIISAPRLLQEANINPFEITQSSTQVSKNFQKKKKIPKNIDSEQSKITKYIRKEDTLKKSLH